MLLFSLCLEKELIQLDLRGNNIGDQGAFCLSDALQDNMVTLQFQLFL